MELNKFEVKITKGKEITHKGAFYQLIPHMTQYGINIVNGWGQKMQARVIIDGKKIGDFVINPYQSATIETDPSLPEDERGKFTAIAKHTKEAFLADIDKLSEEKAGLIEVVCAPEKLSAFVPPADNDVNYRRGYKGGYRGKLYTSMGTGMTGKSDQKFQEVNSFELDETNETVFMIRFIRDEQLDVRPLRGENKTKYPDPHPSF